MQKIITFHRNVGGMGLGGYQFAYIYCQQSGTCKMAVSQETGHLHAHNSKCTFANYYISQVDTVVDSLC